MNCYSTPKYYFFFLSSFFPLPLPLVVVGAAGAVAGASPDFCTPNVRAMVAKEMPPTILLEHRTAVE